MPLNLKGKFNFLVYSSFVTAPLSLVASSLALLTIFRSTTEPKRTYQRLICGISVFDIILSLGFALGPLPMLEETGRPGARGNTATCNFQGFLLQLGCASFIYSLMLMIYFVLVIRFRTPEQTIATRIEPFMHLIPILFYGGSALAGTPLQVYNPNGVWCWVSHYPMDCAIRPGVECTRGGKWVDIYGTFFFIGPLFVVIFLIVLCLLIVAITVWQRYREAVGLYYRRGGAAQRRRQGSSSAVNNANNPAAKKTQQVIVQCFLHGLSFVNMLIWNCIQPTFYWKGKPFDEFGKHYFIMAMGIFFFPLQGLFNFLIFIRPRYLKKREVFKDRWFAFVQAVWNSPGATNTPPTTRRRRRRRRGRSHRHLEIEEHAEESLRRTNRSSGLLTTVALTVSRTTGRDASSTAVVDDMKSVNRSSISMTRDDNDNENHQGVDDNIGGGSQVFNTKEQQQQQQQQQEHALAVEEAVDTGDSEHNNNNNPADDNDNEPPTSAADAATVAGHKTVQQDNHHQSEDHNATSSLEPGSTDQEQPEKDDAHASPGVAAAESTSQSLSSRDQHEGAGSSTTAPIVDETST